MTILTIYVSRLTKKILISELGQEPIHFNRKSFAYDTLRTQRTGTEGMSERTIEWLGEPLKIVVYDELARFVQYKNNNLGLALYNYHREVLMRYIETAVDMGLQPLEAIRKFYTKHRITDEDYPHDTAQRRYQSYKTTLKKSRNFGTNAGFSASQNLVLEMRPSDVLIIDKANTVATEYTNKRKRVHKCFARHLQYYLLYTEGRHSIRTVAAKTGSSRNAVWNAVNSIRANLIVDQYLSKLIAG